MAPTEIGPDNPLFLHTSDSPGLKLVSQSFNGKCFSSWKRSMLIALSAKNKLGFIDGSLPRPATPVEIVALWSRCDATVFSWILTVISEEVSVSFLYSSSDKDVWTQLEERFGQTNEAQLFNVQKQLNDISQGNDDSVSTYFTKLKMLWDELDVMGVSPRCSCSCTCGNTAKLVKFQQDKRVVQFLMGLKDSYTVIRGVILMLNPLPSLGVVYNNLLQEEQQRALQFTSQIQLDSASFYARNNSRPPQHQRQYNPGFNATFNPGFNPGHNSMGKYRRPAS
ncbi:uncharacterized protein LOC141607970 [Silene latifolia]|uniref:uncharacterized protein LOC141607970 n=1 Tax=Silene latifolia TaxID=37657 RepID=UPI003D7701E5